METRSVYLFKETVMNISSINTPNLWTRFPEGQVFVLPKESYFLLKNIGQTNNTIYPSLLPEVAITATKVLLSTGKIFEILSHGKPCLTLSISIWASHFYIIFRTRFKILIPIEIIASRKHLISSCNLLQHELCCQWSGNHCSEKNSDLDLTWLSFQNECLIVVNRLRHWYPMIVTFGWKAAWNELVNRAGCSNLHPSSPGLWLVPLNVIWPKVLLVLSGSWAKALFTFSSLETLASWNRDSWDEQIVRAAFRKAMS